MPGSVLPIADSVVADWPVFGDQLTLNPLPVALGAVGHGMDRDE